MSNYARTPAPASPADLGAKVILVTGGAGFLGSHLCERLLADGHEVICLDNFDTGRRANVEHLCGQRFTIVEHDIVDVLPDDLPVVDRIFNLACPASPRHYQRDPLKTALICSRGTLNVLERARRDGATLLHASTSEIYGDPDIHPQPERYWGNVNTVGPRSCYDEGKRFSETLITDFSRQYGLEARIVRIFNTYGPRMQFDDGRVVSNFIVQALTGHPLTIYGDGSQTRSFCFVDDLIEGFIRAMASQALGSLPVNLGNPEEYDVRELAELVLEMTGSASRIVQEPLPVDDPRRRRPDITRARTLLSWQPSTPLRLGLDATIREFAARLSRDEAHARLAPAAARLAQ
jgi:UDP-glucuronate decarboxylase